MALSYPRARTGDDRDDYHGEAVSDPYRWLEDTGSPETSAWIAAQNELTESFLAAVPARAALAARLTQLWDYPKAGVPFERGGRWFQSRNSGLQAQPVLYVMDAPDAPGRPLLDPGLLAADGTVAVGEIHVSHDGSLLAYATSGKGSDWQTWRVRDVATATDLDDVIEWSKFSEAAWLQDGSGFFYGAIQPASPGAEYVEANTSMRIFFHRIGTGQSDDRLIFAAAEPDWFPYATVSDDGRYLVITVDRGSTENQVHVLDLTDQAAGFERLVPDFASKAVVVTSAGTTFYLLTDDRAPRHRLVRVDLGRPGREDWQEVIAETADALLDVRFFGGRFVCHYLRQACSVLRVHEVDGTFVREIPVPPFAALGGHGIERAAIEGRPGSDTVYFETVSFTNSGSLWSHELSSGQTTLVRAPTARIDADDFVTEQVLAPSADGTPVPMFVTRRRDLMPDGDVPVLLYAYGGFDVAITPEFSPRWAAWLDRGGLLAVANLRGGGEYGDAWHEAGRLDRKQNTFDDFCGCAEWLVASGWSRPERIAISGASNGGLLVGACLTQRPELFGACVPEVGVFDMLRFHKFTIGWSWRAELGDPDDPAQYPWLRAYSPLHNVRPGVRYPPTMLLTADHDDRVVPGHSFKFTATLQAAQGGQLADGESGGSADRPGARPSGSSDRSGPILARIESAAGHGAGKPTAKEIATATDILAFLDAVLAPARTPA